MVNIVLDLDETLIHTIVCDRKRANLEKAADFNFQLGQDKETTYYVFKRPGINEFLTTVFKDFKRIGIWTAADSMYAKIVIKNILNYQQIMRLDFVFSRNFCDHDRQGFYKPLSKIYAHYPKWHPEETIMLDNSVPVMRQNPQNGLIAIDFLPPNLRTDIFLLLLNDVFKDSLPKYRVYAFVAKCNKYLPGISDMYLQSLDSDSNAGQQPENSNNAHGTLNKSTICRNKDGASVPDNIVIAQTKKLDAKQRKILQQAVKNVF